MGDMIIKAEMEDQVYHNVYEISQLKSEVKELHTEVKQLTDELATTNTVVVSMITPFVCLLSFAIGYGLSKLFKRSYEKKEIERR